MAKKSVRRSISMTQEMRDRLALLVSRQPRDTTEADLIREAVRLFLDDQEDLIGSRKYFQKSLQGRLDRLEAALAFHLNVLIYLLAALDPEGSPERIAEAILAARQDGDTLLAQMNALRERR